MLFCFLKYSLKQPFFLKQSLYLKKTVQFSSIEM